MKTLYMFLIFIFLFTTAQAQEIEATLSGSTASQAFSVKDDVGNTLFRVRGDGKVGIGTSSPQGALDVVSTTGAFIVPRMTTTQRNALTPVNGMIIYNTSMGVFQFRQGGTWESPI